MIHGDEFVLKPGCWGQSAVLIHTEHSFENINELFPVGLLTRLVDPVQVGGQVHLLNVIHAVEHELPSLFRFCCRLHFVFVLVLQTPLRCDFFDLKLITK